MVTHSPTESFDNTSAKQGFDQSHIASEQWSPRQRGDSTGGGGPTGTATADLPACYQQVFGHLRNGEACFEQQGVKPALPEYYAAIQAADRVDQNAVNREAAMVMQTLQQGGLDTQTQRQLQQEMMNLQALHEASGIARANLGLLFLRNGLNDQGMALLQEAAKADPNLAKDPNFQRHFRDDLQAGAQLAQGDTGAGNGGAGVAGGGIPGADQGSGTGAQSGDARTPGRVGDQTQAQQYSQTFGGKTPYQKAQELASQVTGPLDQNGLQTLANAFGQVIDAADAGQSPRADGAKQQWMAALAQLQQAYAPKKEAVHAVDQQLINEIKKANLSADDLALAQRDFQRLGQASSLKEYQDLEKDLARLVPTAAQFLNQRDQILGADFLKAMWTCNQFKDNFEAEQNQSASTRMQFARALAKAGDMDDAKKYMADAVAHNTSPDLEPLLLAQAEQMGVTQADLDNAQRAMQSTARTGTDPTTGTAPSRQPLTGDNTGNGTGGPGAGAGADNTGGQLQTDLIGTAQDPAMAKLQAALDAFNKPGDAQKGLQAADAQFQQAVSLADRELASLPTIDQIKAQLDKVFPPEKQAAYDKLDAQLKQLVSTLSQADQQAWKDIDAKKVDQATAKAFLDKHPDVKQILTQQNDLTKDAQPLYAEELQLKGAMDNRMLAHLKYAQALAMANDSRAKDVLMKGLDGVPQDLQKKYMQNEDVANLLKQLQTAGGGPTGADNTGGTGTGAGGNRTGSDAGNGTGSTDNTQGAADASIPAGMIKSADGIPVKPTGDANVDKLMQQQTLKQLLNSAELNSKDGIDQAAPYYKAACAIGDAIDSKALSQTIQQNLDAAKNPQTSPADRDKAYGDAIGAISTASAASMIAHQEYAKKLMTYHKWEDASNQWDQAVKASDKIPTDLAQQLYTQLNRDINDKQLPETLRSDLNSMAKPLKGAMNSPIDVREDAAQFNLSGGKNEKGEPIGIQMQVGWTTKGEPQFAGVDSRILNPEKAAQYTQQAADLTQKIKGIDISKTPDLDSRLASLRSAVLINSPEGLKKQLEKSHHMWENATSTLVSTAVGIGTAALVIGLMSKGDEGAALQVRALRTAIGGAVGFGTATASNYGMEKGVFGREDWTFWDSTKLGGGVYAATGAALLTTRAGLGYYFGKVGESGAANQTMLDGLARATGKAARLGDIVTPTAERLGAQGVLPGMEDLVAGNAAVQSGRGAVLIDDLAMRYTGASREIQTGFKQAADVFSSKAQESTTLGQAIKSAETTNNTASLQALQKARNILGRDDITLTKAASELKGNGYKLPSGLQTLMNKYPGKALSEVLENPEFEKLKDAQWVKAHEVEANSLKAEQQAVNNMLGNTAAQRTAALRTLLPKETQKAINLAARAGENRSWLSKTGDVLAKPFVPLKAGRIPTWSEWTGATIGSGTVGAGIYNIGSTYFNSTAAFEKGDSTVRPEDVVADSFKLFNKNGINPNNIYTQSLLTGWALGNVSVAAHMWNGTSWSMARAANPGVVGFGKAALRTGGSALWQSSKWLSDAFVPADDAAWSQLRQGVFKPIPFLTGYTEETARSGKNTASEPWEDSLADLNRPLKNEANYHIPVRNSRGQILDDGSDDDQDADDAGQKQGQPGAGAGAGAGDKPQQKPATNSTEQGSGDGSDIDPAMKGNIQ